MENRVVKVGIVQHQVDVASSAENVRDVLASEINELAAQGTDLIVLPELHDHPYFCVKEDPENFDLAEKIPGEACEFYSALALKNKVVLVSSLFEKRAAGIYHNTVVVFEKDGSIAGKYRKMHIPDDPGFYEKFYFTPGDLGFEPIDTSVGRLGVLICWDQWYPEAARLMCLKGADILIYPTAIGWSLDDDQAEKKRQLESWQMIQKSHAIANGVPVVSINRVGEEITKDAKDGPIDFWGCSFVCGPQGEELINLGSEVKSAAIELNLNRSEQVRRWWPFFRDRRIESYGDILKRYNY